MNVVEAILARGHDDAVAVAGRDRRVTYAELRAAVLRVAGGLLELGGVKGERVGLLSENSPFFLEAYLGTIRAGLTIVPLPTEMTEVGFAEIVGNTGMNRVFLSPRFLGRVGPWARKLGLSVLTERAMHEKQRSLELAFPEISPRRDLAALMFTSGSTGSPKGVMVTHRNIECNTLDIITYMGLDARDRVMTVLPFHYCFGLSLAHTHLMAGGTLVLNNEFKLFPESVLQDLIRLECTGIAGVPSTYQILLRKSRFASLAFPHLRWLQQAGGKLPNPCIEELRRAVPHARFFLMYGQTEGTARLSYLPPERLEEKLGSIGRGLPSTRLEVLGPDGAPVPPGSGEVGEIVARGDNVALGYWNDPVETGRYFRNGKLHTGDLARVDAEGFIYIVEREREVIKSGGNRVSAREIEDVVAELRDVVEVAVVGAPHELLGEAIKAFVTLAPHSSLTARDIEAHCRKRLPAFKAPEEVILLRTMVHNSAGKVLKRELRRLLQSRAGAEASTASHPPAECCPA
jgi:acyl-CoA synthetase (AMP-forming)/AMP-acid ligase II